MKMILALAAAALLAICIGGAKAQQNLQSQCAGVAQFAVGAASSKLLVAAIPGKRIGVCGWYASNNTPSPTSIATFQIVTGNDPDCKMNTVTMTPQITVTSWIQNIHQYGLEQGASGASLCITGNGTAVGAISGAVYYLFF